MSKFNKADILEIVSAYVELEEKGYGDNVYYVGLCPFHEDKTPSFTVYPNSQKAYCWSCKSEGMDVIDFIKNIKGCSFEEAVSLVAKEYSIEKVLQNKIDKLLIRTNEVDMLPFALKLNKIYNNCIFEVAQARAKRIMTDISNGQYAKALLQ